MASHSMRTVRRALRRELLGSIERGNGTLPVLAEITDRLLGQDVGYHLLLRTFVANEVGKALAVLRNEGKVETTGRLWKPVEHLDEDDVQIISVRRLKRLRGELKAQLALARDHGRTDDVEAASRMLEIVMRRLAEHPLDGGGDGVLVS